jgi:hypothetical protein
VAQPSTTSIVTAATIGPRLLVERLRIHAAKALIEFSQIKFFPAAPFATERFPLAHKLPDLRPKQHPVPDQTFVDFGFGR